MLADEQTLFAASFNQEHATEYLVPYLSKLFIHVQHKQKIELDNKKENTQYYPHLAQQCRGRN